MHGELTRWWTLQSIKSRTYFKNYSAASFKVALYKDNFIQCFGKNPNTICKVFHGYMPVEHLFILSICSSMPMLIKKIMEWVFDLVNIQAVNQ